MPTPFPPSIGLRTPGSWIRVLYVKFNPMFNTTSTAHELMTTAQKPHNPASHNFFSNKPHNVKIDLSY